MANDTSRRWFNRPILVRLILTALLCWWCGPALRLALEPNCYPFDSGIFQPDFFQERASARNRFNRLPIDAPHEITLERYVGIRPNTTDGYFIAVSAHLPTSVLLALPFAGSEFPDAVPLWNVLSLLALAASAWLIVLQLDLPFFLLGICCPLPSSYYQGRGE